MGPVVGDLGPAAGTDDRIKSENETFRDSPNKDTRSLTVQNQSVAKKKVPSLRCASQGATATADRVGSG